MRDLLPSTSENRLERPWPSPEARVVTGAVCTATAGNEKVVLVLLYGINGVSSPVRACSGLEVVVGSTELGISPDTSPVGVAALVAVEVVYELSLERLGGRVALPGPVWALERAKLMRSMPLLGLSLVPSTPVRGTTIGKEYSNGEAEVTFPVVVPGTFNKRDGIEREAGRAVSVPMLE
jgi:hypothetical protein